MPPKMFWRASKESATPKRSRGDGHELHQAPRALRGDRQGVEFGFDLDHGLHQVGAHLVVGGRLLDVLVVLAGVGATRKPREWMSVPLPG